MSIRRLTALLLALVLCVALCACDSGESEKKNDSADQSGTESVNSTDSKDESSDVEESESTEESVSSEEESVEETTSDDVSGESSDACTPLLYKVVDSDGDEMYLFGTIHCADDRLVFPDYVLDAYAASEFLCVEADVIAFEEDIAAAMQLTKKLLCPAGTTVKDYMDAEVYEAAVELLKEKEAYFTLYDNYKPYLFYDLISQCTIEDTDLDLELGVDRTLLNMAKEEGKEIREAESVEFQYDMLLGFSDELVSYLIANSVEYYDDGVAEVVELYELWLSGDENAFVEYLSASDEVPDNATAEELALYEEYNKAMIVDRNLNMADLVEDYLEEGKTGFFAVGAAHIVGDGALAQLLADRGYTVTVVE